MLTGRLPNGRPIVAYETVEDAIIAMSCGTCSKYTEELPCRFYAVCRASKEPSEPPYMYKQASDVVINNRLTTIEGDISGLTRSNI